MKRAKKIGRMAANSKRFKSPSNLSDYVSASRGYHSLDGAYVRMDDKKNNIKLFYSSESDGVLAITKQTEREKKQQQKFYELRVIRVDCRLSRPEFVNEY